MLNDPETWPLASAKDPPPYFALGFTFSTVVSVQELSDEWSLGSLRQDGTRGPPVKALEERYGPAVRTGMGQSGSSYRSKKYRNSQAVDYQFAKRKRV